MTKVILDPELRERLHGLTHQIELCDESGRTLAYVLPSEDYLRWAYEWARSQISDEELEEARREPGGRTTAEVLEWLEQQ